MTSTELMQGAIDKLDVLIAEKKKFIEENAGMGSLPYHEFLGMIQGWEMAQDILFLLMEHGE